MPKAWLAIKSRQQGFSPLEVLLAGTLFGFLVVALAGAIVYGRQSVAESGNRNRAVMIAEEGLEASRNIAAASYTNLVDSSGGSTVGNTAIEAGSDVNSNATTAYKVTTGVSGGSVSSISIYIKTIDSLAPHIQAAIYADSGGAPGARLGVGAIQVAVANSWNTFSISGVTVSASTSYWLALSSEGNNTFADSGDASSTAYDLASGYPAPSTFFSSTTATDRPSFYMTIGGGTQGLIQQSGQWAFSGSSDITDSFYTRQISIASAGTNRKKVTSTVSWPQGNSTAQVSVDTYMTNWLATIIPTITPGPIMMAYSKTTTTPFYRIWNSSTSTWGAEGSAQAVTGNINYVVLKSSRTRNEAILGVQTSTGAIYVQVWNGTSWGNLTQVGTGPTTTRAFDIAYEENGDRAVIAYSPSSGSADFAYRIWNGSSLTTPITVNQPPTTGAINWIELDNNPISTSNDIALIMSDATTAVYGMVWNGTSWGTMGTSTTWDTTTSTAAKKNIDVAYEQTSGKAMFLWGDSTATNQVYRTWNGTTLSANTTLTIAAEGGIPEWVQLASRPSSNEIMLGVQDAAADLNTRKWSGSAWDTATQHAEHSGTTENIQSRNFDIIWETHTSNPGKAWLVWGDSTAGATAGTTMTKQWSGTAWGTSSTLASSDETSFVRLRADPVSGAVLAGIYQNSTAAAGAQDISERHLTGGGTAWSAKNQIWSGATSADPVFFRIDIATP